ncbi:MAG: Clp protease N-terminal domain-containing protein, partial [Cyanobacteria bacterium P01_H01_bin.105]
MFERFNDKATSALMIAQQQASQLGQRYVGTELILIGVIAQGDSLVSPIARAAGITLQAVQTAVESILKSEINRKQTFTDIPFTPGATQLLEQATKEAQQLDQSDVGPEHLLLAITSSNGSAAAKILQTLGIDLVSLRIAIIRAVGERLPANRKDTPDTDSNSFTGKALQEFTTDLTQLAAAGKIDPVVGRTQEIERVVQILGRRSKNNPVLIGEPGVGKTAIAEGLAQRIVNQDVPDLLFDQRVLSLDINSLIAGTQFRGDFEERLKQIMAAVTKAGNIILLIDEIHTLV